MNCRLKYFYIFTVVFLIQSLAFAASVGPIDKIKIGFLLSDPQGGRNQKEIEVFKTEATSLGFEVVIPNPESGANTHANTQRLQIKKLLALGIKALVIQPVTLTDSSDVELAHKYKVPVVAYEHLIHQAPIDFFVTQDGFRVGVLQAQEAIKFVKEKSPNKKIYRFVILKGQAQDLVADAITSGAKSVLNKEKSIQIVLEKNHKGGSRTQAMATVEQVLAQTGNKIDAILAHNSAMAQGAVQALIEQGMVGKVFVAGADADLSAIQSIVNGRQQFEVIKDITASAKTAAQVAFQLAKGEVPISTESVLSGKFKIPASFAPVYGVSMADLDQRIFAAGIYTKQAVFEQ